MRAVASIHYPISNRQHSHRGSWAKIWADLLYADVIYSNDEYEKHDEVYIYHGMEWSGSFNLFGGAQDVTQFQRFLDAKCRFFSLDIDMPDYGAIGKTRLNNCSEEWAKFDWDALSEKCKQIPKIQMSDLQLSHLIVGDSHANSVYKSKSMVDRHDGKTLYGALKQGLESYVEPYYHNNLSKVTFYFGNIDIRHHILRYPESNALELMDNYERELKKVHDKYGVQIAVVAPLWIENESRKLPKSGYHNGTPFYGDWSSRERMRELFTNRIFGMCSKHGWEFKQHSESLKNDKGELDFECMEKPKSVHLSPKYYMEEKL
jgi:hypothetical protein